ncbi:MAG: hypothetical protein NTZ78_09970 [Candidatus Aureabacteria bacterium]|nr:hypothetical protein [Candidatus Auribacterota bacterium]
MKTIVTIVAVVLTSLRVGAQTETPSPTQTETPAITVTSTYTATPTIPPTATPTLTMTPIPAPTIRLSLNNDTLKPGDEMWLTLDFTVPEGSYDGTMDAYIAVETPHGLLHFFQGISRKLSISLFTPFDNLTQRTKSPQIALALNNSPSFGGICLNYTLAYGTKSQQNLADIYCVLAAPNNKSYWYTYPDKFFDFSTPHSVTATTRIQNDASGWTDYSSLWDQPKGIYTWYAVLVRPSKDAKNPKNWLCRLSKASFEIGNVEYIAYFVPYAKPCAKALKISQDFQYKVGPVAIMPSYDKGSYIWKIFLLKSGSAKEEDILSHASIPFDIVPNQQIPAASSLDRVKK